MSINHDINLLKAKARRDRQGAIKRLQEATQREGCDTVTLALVTKSVIPCLEDTSESVRETAIDILTDVTPRQTSEVLHHVLNGIVMRVGHEEIVEESEELRLKLLLLGKKCLECFKHDVGRLGYLDHYRLLLENCMKDPYPELKRETCFTIRALCEAEPKEVKAMTMPLAKVVKNHGLQHKHAAVRVEAVHAFACLIQHGAADILGDTKDEQDNRTSIYYIFILCNDHSEAVRKATVNVLTMLLVDITERLDQHRRLLPHVLLLLSDPVDEVRLMANQLMLQLGKQHMCDEEDNRIDFESRRVTLKDIDWYADDAFPDMTLTQRSAFNLPDLNRRPILGARNVIAESARTFLDKVLADIIAVDWSITFSNTSRRHVAMRTLMLIIVFCEKNVVQYLQGICHVLYKTVRDDDVELRHEALVCAEILGKFLEPEHYLPIITAKKESKSDTEDQLVIVQKSKYTTVTQETANVDTSVSSRAEAALPTLFSTAAAVTKAGILKVFRCFVVGSQRAIKRDSAVRIVQALSSAELRDTESPPLCSALVECIASAVTVLVGLRLVSSPSDPLDPAVAKDWSKQTLDSVLFYALLCIRSSEDPAIVKDIDAGIEQISRAVTGTAKGIYDLHFGRIMYKHVQSIPAPAVVDMVQSTEDLAPYVDYLTDMWVFRLSEVNYQLRVTAELSYFSLMARVLGSKKVVFTGKQLELLLRSVILTHGKYQPGHASHLFRKLACSCLRHLLNPFHRGHLKQALADEDSALTEKVAGVWLNSVDGDDAELRLVCVDAMEDVCKLANLSAGAGSNVYDAMVSRFDDAVDEIRLRAFQALTHAVYNSCDVSFALLDVIKHKLADLTKVLLLHMDDTRENVGIKPEICKILKCLKGMDRNMVDTLVKGARDRHATPKYCDEVLQFLPN